MASRADVELYRELVLIEWRRAFDVGGPHWSRTIRDEGTLDHVAARIAEEIRVNTRPSLVAGRALYRIVAFHPFGDCNHRTGWAVCNLLMLQAGGRLVASTDAVVRFVKSIDQFGRSEDDVVTWVREAFSLG